MAYTSTTGEFEPSIAHLTKPLLTHGFCLPGPG